jgi:hypothetical protein
MYDKIVNPETGRKVNINSKLGQQILRNYNQQIGGATEAELDKAMIRIDIMEFELNQFFSALAMERERGRRRETFDDFQKRFWQHINYSSSQKQQFKLKKYHWANNL